jgi:transcriptional regulator with XRE-family HTH domain
MTTADRRYLNRKQRELNAHRGIPNRVDAKLARAHIANLRRTMGWIHLASATGCSAAHLREIADGRRAVINRGTHQKILSVRPTPAPDAGFYIDATGTRRRIHALQAIGHSQEAIARAAGTTQHRISVVSLGAERVRQKLADKVANAYDKLAQTPPADNRFTRRVRGHAAEQGWFDPQFWEDVDRIDDPGFNPAATLGDTPKYIRLAENALWLKEQDYTAQQIADRLGESSGYIAKAISRYREAGLVAA